MPILKPKPRRSKLDSVQIAKDWLETGITPIPLYPESKKPRGKAWQNRRLTQETIEQFFERGDNIGGLWGEPSDGIVDVDLDWDEASQVAPYLLTETFIYGRTARPASHYLYRCRGAASTKFTLADGTVVAEIRSTGAQSVLPPSIHPTGDRYSIDHETDFSSMTPGTLETLVREVAAAAVLIRNFPESGSRHDYIHSITGALLWGEWDEGRTQRFVSAIISCTIDDDKNQRERTLKNTMEHFKKGDRVQGWTTLAQWLEPKILSTLKKWLVSKTKFEKPPSLNLDLQLNRIPIFDKALTKVPGLVGQIAEWSSRQSYLKQPSFDLACGLMCTAIASSNKYLVGGRWNTPLQPYLMILAPTAAGKNASLTNVYKFAKEIGIHDNVYQGFQSYYALLDQLAEPPHMACWLWDEAARHLAAAKSTSSPDHSTITHLTSLYGKATEFVPAAPGRRTAIPALDHPFLTLMATAQPAALLDAVTVSNVATGFVNRLILFDAGDGAPLVNRERENLFPSAIRKQALELKKHQVKGNQEFTLIPFDTVATNNMFDDFDVYARSIAVKGDEYEAWGRANQNSLLIAGIVAVGINPTKPMITELIAMWAINLIKWSISCWMVRIGESSSRSNREAQSKRIEAQVRRVTTMVHRAGNEKYAALMRTGQMPRAILQRLNRDLNKREMDDILEMLVESGILGMDEEESGGVTFWPKSR